MSGVTTHRTPVKRLGWLREEVRVDDTVVGYVTGEPVADDHVWTACTARWDSVGDPRGYWEHDEAVAAVASAVEGRRGAARRCRVRHRLGLRPRPSRRPPPPRRPRPAHRHPARPRHDARECTP